MVDTTAYMSALGDALVIAARTDIGGGPMGKPARAIVKKSVSATQVVIEASSPATVLMSGWPRQQMTWLRGKTVRFTPKGSGTPIVRRVSDKSLAAGGWTREARDPEPVFEQAWSDPPVQALAAQVAYLAVADLTANSSAGQGWSGPPPSTPLEAAPLLLDKIWGP